MCVCLLSLSPFSLSLLSLSSLFVSVRVSEFEFLTVCLYEFMCQIFCVFVSLFECQFMTVNLIDVFPVNDCKVSVENWYHFISRAVINCTKFVS